MNITKEQLEEIREALLPFATMGAECEDGRTSFNINFGDQQGCITKVTERDFVRAYQMFVKLGESNMPDYIRPERKSDDNVWPLRGVDNEPFHKRAREERMRAPPQFKPLPAGNMSLFPWFVLLLVASVVIIVAALS